MTSKQFSLELNHHCEALFSHAQKFTHDFGDAQALIQDTMLKAVKSFHTYEQGTNIRSWLFVIMKNTFINDYRKSMRARNCMIQREEISSAHLFSSAHRNIGECSLALADINRALSKLNEIYRIAFVMYIEGYKYEEIADELGIPVGTVKTRLHTAREQLKLKLRAYC